MSLEQFSAPQPEYLNCAPDFAETEQALHRPFLQRAKSILGSVALTLGIVAGHEVADATLTPQFAQAATEFTNDYPDLGAPCYPPSIIRDANGNYVRCNNFDWRKPTRNAQGAITGWPEWTSRGYGVDNCTDGVAYWVSRYTGVDIRGLGNASEWEAKAADRFVVHDGTTNSIEPGDIAQSDDGADGAGHVGFITSVTKNADGAVTSFTDAELNAAGIGEYSTHIYNTRNPAGNFVRYGSYDWDHFIDVNGAGKGLNNEDISAPPAAPGPAGPSFVPAMVQRSSGETDLAVVGPGNSLVFYYNAVGSPNWGSMTIPGAQAFGNPAMVQRPNGETDIVAPGPDHSLEFYFNTPGSLIWHRLTIAPPGSAYGGVAMMQRPTGETDVAVEGPNHTLAFYYNASGSPVWGGGAMPGTQAYGQPAMLQRSSGETDIAVQGAGNSLEFYYNAQGSNNWGVSHVAIPGWSASAPAMVQRSSGETDIAVEGPNHSLDFYMNSPGSNAWGRVPVAGGGTTDVAPNSPAMIQRPNTGETDISVRGPGSRADFYYNRLGSPGFGMVPVAVNGYSLRAPVMAQRPTTGETDMSIIGPGGRLDFYMNTAGSPYFGVIPIAGERSAS